MLAHFLDLLRQYLAQYGYITVAIALLLENAGVPVPGETVLLLASFMAYSEHRLHLSHIIIVAVASAVVGDNIGYALGRYSGRPMLDRYRKIFFIRGETIAKAERLFERHGAKTILLARFIAGVRIVAGPLAGALRMNWLTFLICNCVGAIVWVLVISGVGYWFGEYEEQIIRGMHHANLVIFLAVVVAIAFVWWRWSRRNNKRT